MEFEVASIKTVAPVGFFHAADSGSGGPGSADPGMYRCTCLLSSLVTKAFDLQRYQFPGQQQLPRETFSISAKVPEGATAEQFRVMLQNLLKTRFGLAYHFEKKELQGYQLTVAKNGWKLKESVGPAVAQSGQHGGGHDASSWATRSGLMVTSNSAKYRADHQTTSQLAQVLSDQLARPVEDQTGMKGAYDVLLTWSGDTAHDHPSTMDSHGGGAGHGDHGGAGAPGDAQPASGPTLFDAVQSQLGLKLVAAKKSAARIFVVDHINKVPTEN